MRNRAWLLILAAPVLVAALPTVAEGDGPFAAAPYSPPVEPRATAKFSVAPFNLLTRVGAVVSARMSKVRNTYDERIGPRTVYDLEDVETACGSVPDGMTVSLLGGPLPDGRTLTVTDLPTFVEGRRYLIAFADVPLGTEQVLERFRLEQVGGRVLALTDSGRPVFGWSERSPVVGERSVLDGDRADSPLIKGAADLVGDRAVSFQQVAIELCGAARSFGANLSTTISEKHPADYRWNATPGSMP